MNFHQHDFEEKYGVYCLFISSNGEVTVAGDMVRVVKETTVSRLVIFLPQHLFAVPKITKVSV